MRTTTTLVVLKVMQDHPSATVADPWWKVLGLPKPERWSEIGENVHVREIETLVRVEEHVDRLSPAVATRPRHGSALRP